jgi:sugar (pentulose or hexulose) kinase
MVDVIAIFDIGKTNKKVLLFDKDLRLVFQEEQCFPEIKDDDGFPCDDIGQIEKWITKSVEDIIAGDAYNIKAVNFSTYGASVVYLDENGKRITPVYNYLKPMPPSVLEGFYESYGGIEEFSRRTASPPSGMLNSGLQILWLKKNKPSVFSKVKSIAHFPQYLSYLFTGKLVAEYTYIGCHTSLWDFDRMDYHPWLRDYDIHLTHPVPSNISFPATICHREIEVGIGIHDSSASIVPYFSDKDPFVLLSTGTWCIFMNPFNDEPLTADQLNQDALCYLSVQQKPVKSARLFMGHIHQENVKRIATFFHVEDNFFKGMKPDEVLLKQYLSSDKKFFKQGIPKDYVDMETDLSVFKSAHEAYHRLIVDLTRVAMDSMSLVLAKNDDTKSVYISGGFARNEIFVRLIATLNPGKKVYTSEIDNSTALGAALTVWDKAFKGKSPVPDLGLSEVFPII